MSSNTIDRNTVSADKRLRRELEAVDPVRLAYLFGSRARGGARSDSDFDIAILVDDELASPEHRGATLRRLAGRLGRAVSSAHLDIVLLNDAPPLLRHRVLRDGRLLFARTEHDRVRFTIETIRDYQDGYYRREGFLEERIARLQDREPDDDDGGSGELLEKARGVARLLEEAEGVP